LCRDCDECIALSDHFFAVIRIDLAHIVYYSEILAQCFGRPRNMQADVEQCSDGMQRTEGVAGPGTLVSELALVTLVERKFTAVAREDTSIIRITRALFHRLIEEYPDAARLIENRIRDNLAELAAKAASQFYRFS